MNNVYDFWLNVMANGAQLKSYEILKKDFNNTDLMKYLKHQDNLLDKIIEQNDEILKLLKGDKENDRKN